MTNQKNTQSVLVVASGQKSGGFLQEMLPPSKFSPVLTARDVGSAQRMLIERDVDLVLINTPLPDDFGVQLAVEASEKYNCGVLVFVKAELLEAVEQKVEEYGILTLPRPTSRQIVYQTLHLLAASRRKIRALGEPGQAPAGGMSENERGGGPPLHRKDRHGPLRPAAGNRGKYYPHLWKLNKAPSAAAI